MLNVIHFSILICTSYLAWRQRDNKRNFVVTILIAILVFFSTLLNIKNERDVAKENALYGNLSSSRLNDTGFITIVYGGNKFTNSINSLKTGIVFNPFQSANFDAPIIIRFIQEKLSISAKVSSHARKIISEIENNNWRVNPSNFFKRNFDDSAFEVIDNYGNVVLQLELFGNEKVLINAVLYYKNIVQIATESGLFLIPIERSSISYPDQLRAILQKHKIQPWFSYSSDKVGIRSSEGKKNRERYKSSLKLRQNQWSKYSDLSIKELNKLTRKYTKTLRTLVDEAKIESISEDTPKKDFKESLNFYSDSLFFHISLLRNAILLTYPKQMRPKLKYLMYENPVSPRELEIVADNLELLSLGRIYQELSNSQFIDSLTALNKELTSFLKMIKAKEDLILKSSFPPDSKNFNTPNNSNEKSNESSNQLLLFYFEKARNFKSQFESRIIVSLQQANSRYPTQAKTLTHNEPSEVFIRQVQNDLFLENFLSELSVLIYSLRQEE